MSNDLIIVTPRQLQDLGLDMVPKVFASSDSAARRFIEFFTATIRNRNTRRNYAQAVGRFAQWCEEHQLQLEKLTPVVIAAYIEELGQAVAAPTVKLHLAGIRMLFDFLTTGGIMPFNPASSVRGPKHRVKVGKTPVLTAEETRQLLESIGTDKISGLRDRAMIAMMVYSFARIGAALKMDVKDYYQQGKRWWLRLHEKGGKRHQVPVHHKLEEYLDDYLAGAKIADDKDSPLFRRLDRKRQLTWGRLDRREVLAMLKRRARAAGLGDELCCHTFRATGITTYLQNGGTIERAASIANHESTRTTQLYNRTDDQLTLDEIEKIQI